MTIVTNQRGFLCDSFLGGIKITAKNLVKNKSEYLKIAQGFRNLQDVKNVDILFKSWPWSASGKV